MARHRILTRLLWLHVPALFLLGLLGPMPAWEVVVLPLAVASFAVGAAAVRTTHIKAELTSLGLITCTFVAIELSGGAMSSHIHLYAILIFVALYQQWRPMLWAVLVVAIHHTAFGLLAPEHVFGMHMHAGRALVNVAVHAGLALLEAVGILIFWHFAEGTEREIEALAETETERRMAEESRQKDRNNAVELERERVTQLHERAARVSADAATIGDGARAAIAAVAAVELELAKLTTAVEDIAQRSGRASGTASSGQNAAATAAEKVRKLERSVSEIAEVNAMIARLAGQTNLLSLNATIEAARAGDMGRGFAVVASEVKQLANETSSSADKVKKVIVAITGETDDVARSFVSTSAVIGEMLTLQLEMVACIKHQALVMTEVTRQLAKTTEAAGEVLVGLDRLTATAAG
jgi:methyl-accepting chemotaxis protein